MPKNCKWGLCKSNTKYLPKDSEIRFWPFPKPCKDFRLLQADPSLVAIQHVPQLCTQCSKCLQWIKACKVQSLTRLDDINKTCYVCSKHFRSGAPTHDEPHPLPAGTGDRDQVHGKSVNQKTKGRGHRKVLALTACCTESASDALEIKHENVMDGFVVICPENTQCSTASQCSPASLCSTASQGTETHCSTASQCSPASLCSTASQCSPASQCSTASQCCPEQSLQIEDNRFESFNVRCFLLKLNVKCIENQIVIHKTKLDCLLKEHRRLKDLWRIATKSIAMNYKKNGNPIASKKRKMAPKRTEVCEETNNSIGNKVGIANSQFPRLTESVGDRLTDLNHSIWRKSQLVDLSLANFSKDKSLGQFHYTDLDADDCVDDRRSTDSPHVNVSSMKLPLIFE